MLRSLLIFPNLWKDSGDQFFHGLIEVGYGVEILPDSPEIAKKIISSGLAYLSFGYYYYGKPKWLLNFDGKQIQRSTSPTNSQHLSPFDILNSLRSDPLFNEQFSNHNPGVQVTMNRLINPKYQARLSDYDIPLPESYLASLESFYSHNDLSQFKKELENIVQLFIQTTFQLLQYTKHYDFFLLHGVTAMRSLKVIIQELYKSIPKYPSNPVLITNSLLYFWRSLVCVYITLGRPEIKVDKNSQSPERNRDWDDLQKELLGRVGECDEEHVIKLFYVAREEYNEHPDDLYKEVAGNLMKVIKHSYDFLF